MELMFSDLIQFALWIAAFVYFWSPVISARNADNLEVSLNINNDVIWAR